MLVWKGAGATDDTNLGRSVSSVEHGNDHPGSGESVPQGDSPKGPYIKYVFGFFPHFQW